MVCEVQLSYHTNKRLLKFKLIVVFTIFAYSMNLVKLIS
jgi:hypothetical protein